MVTSKAPAEISIDEFLGPPAHIPRSEWPKFRKLHEKIRRALKPKDIIGELEAREYTEKIFEQTKLKRHQASLVKSMLHISRNTLLEASGLPPLSLKEGNDNEELKVQLEALGITDDTVEANAFNLQRDVYEILERLINYRSRACSRIERRARERFHLIDSNSADEPEADGQKPSKQRRPKRR